MESAEHKAAAVTVVLSDLHLSDAQLPDETRPLWKRFKHPDLFIDESFERLLVHLDETYDKPIELVLNGDIFDFDSIVALPKEPDFPVSWLEKRRGLHSAQDKSLFKTRVIIETHPIWFDALCVFLEAGHRVVFVIGNHDIELHWPAAQKAIRERLNMVEERQRLRFCEWFYISNEDTLIEHSNQYDAYCLCNDPIRPFIKKSGDLHVRTPFGNLASKIMVNGMGLFNPNVESGVILSAKEYLLFYLKYMVRIQPLLLFTWFWSATSTLVVSLWEGLLPPHKNPFVLEKRIGDIARRANATPGIARALKELHVHPAIFNPWLLLRELWLDRAILFMLLLYISLQGFAFVNVFISIPLWCVLLPMLVLMPMFLFYARSVSSDIEKAERKALERVPDICRIAGVDRVVYGHTHKELFIEGDNQQIINTGNWSPAYHDVECTQPYGRKCVALIEPTKDSRRARLMEWQDPGLAVIRFEPEQAKEQSRQTVVKEGPSRTENVLGE